MTHPSQDRFPTGSRPATGAQGSDPDPFAPAPEEETAFDPFSGAASGLPSVPVVPKASPSSRAAAEHASGAHAAAASGASAGPSAGGDDVAAVRTAPQDVFGTTQDLSSAGGAYPSSGYEDDAFGEQAEEASPFESSGPVENPSPATTVASYPSAEALPVRKSTTAGGLARGLRRIMGAEALPTAPLRIVESLSNTPFANPRRNKEHSEARKTLNFALEIAETMFHYGGGSLEVESAIAAVCATYGVVDVDVDITNQSVTINYVSGSSIYDRPGTPRSDKDAEIFSHTVVRVVRSWSDNYSGLTRMHRLVKTITNGELSRPEAEKRLQRIKAEPKPFAPRVVRAANMLAGAFIVMGLGGTWRGAALAALVFMVVNWVSGKLSKWRVPTFFVMASGAAITTLVALVSVSLGLPVSAPRIVASGLIMLLPTLSLVSTIQDAINGFPVTAAGRMVSTGLTFVGLIAGLSVAISVTELFFSTAAHIDVEEAAFGGATPWINVIFMLLATAAVAVTVQVQPRHILPGVLCAASGLAVYYALSPVATGPRMDSMVASVAIGFVSAWIAHRYTIPQVALAVPGLTFLLPGLSIFRGMYMFTVDVDPIQGLVPIISAGAIILSMGASVVLGNYLARPFVTEKRPGRWRMAAPRRR